MTGLELPLETIGEDEITRHCKYSAHMTVLRYTSIEDEIKEKALLVKKKEIIQKLEEDDTPMLYYLLLRAADQFFIQYKRYPGSIMYSLIEFKVFC